MVFFYRINDKVKSFRGCTSMEELLATLNQKNYKLRFQ